MKFAKRMSLILGLTVALSGCQKTEEYMEQGIALLQEEKYQQAAVAFENALAERKDYTATEEEDILLYCGEAYIRAGDFESAVKTYEQLIVKGIENVDTYRFLGLAQYQLGNYEAAKENFLKAVVMGDGSAYGEIGKVEMAIGNYKEAWSNFLRMVEEEPKNPCWQLALGQCKLSQQEYEEALLFFQKGIALVQEEAMEQASDLEQGVAWQQRNGQQQTDEKVYQALLYHQAICYEYLGDYESARELFSVYVTDYPEDEAAKKEYEFLLSR